MKRILLLFIVITLLESCVTKRMCDSKFPAQQVVSDSVSYVEIIRDSISYYSDSSLITALLECDENYNILIKQITSYKQGKGIEVPAIQITNNTLKATCKIDSLAVYHCIKSKIKTQNHDKTIIVKQNYITQWQALQIKMFWVLACIIVAYISFRTLIKSI